MERALAFNSVSSSFWVGDDVTAASAPLDGDMLLYMTMGIVLEKNSFTQSIFVACPMRPDSI